MKLLFKNIKELVQVRDQPIDFVAGEKMQELPTIKNAFLLVENGSIKDFGRMQDVPDEKMDRVVDATGKMILPAWCDSHTHLVYAGHREGEFVDKIKGLSYEEIAKRGGGILNSAQKLAQTTEDDLFQQSAQRIEEIISLGTGAVEIKSGYGLSLESELKMLRVIQRLKQKYDIPIKATFLGAHAIPADYQGNKKGYLTMLVEEVMPIIAQEKLAEYVDIFCESGYFSAEDTAYILDAGQKHGLIPKIHVNQFTSIGGVQVGVRYKALSVDHLEVMTDADIQALKGTTTMPVALPGCSYFLSIPYTPVRKMMAAGLPIALATDFNPGSSPSGNMNFVVATACIKMKMTPEEAINAATINGAYAMGLEKEVGSITRGKRANILLTKPIHSYASIPYLFGSNLIEQVYLNGLENV
ncbi:MAG TPA: imidazolonepropionase [Saprospiraceae bacterium]|nr:imidazolonepropionase [Saprospiraceae bacterium]